MTPQDFIAKWGAPGGVRGPAYELNEEQGAQSHFLDLCELLDVPKPGSAEGYRFEEKSTIIGGRTGYADVFRRGVFAWENKAPGRNLDAALRQLLNYSRALENPPLLVVSDRLTMRIHTQFTGHPSQTHEVLLEELDQPEKRFLLRRVWTAPESFRPKVTTRDITESAAKSFATLADGLRKRGNDPDEVAHFLTQCLFCFFAEDVGLLPGRMFEGLVNNKALTSDKLTLGLTNLFGVMWKGGLYGNDDIPWFNGGLFRRVKVPELTLVEVTELRNAAGLNWSAIDVSIFGTLFERGLDPSKRSQLGAHYTDPATIARIIEPVLTRPLLQQWEQLAQEIRGHLAKSTRKAGAAIKLAGQKKQRANAGDKSYQQAQRLFLGWLEQLDAYRVLDPACGSGNFLFLGLKALKDIEHQSHLDAAEMGLDRQADLVTGPHNVLGIELNEYAAELARVTVWIGELQWRLEHGFPFKQNPVLDKLDHIECRDALLSFEAVSADSMALRSDSGTGMGQTPGAHASKGAAKSPPASAPSPYRSDIAGEATEQEMGSDPRPQGDGSDPVSCGPAGARVATEASWPKASIVIGNPPFLGDKKMRSELGDDYTTTLRKVYKGCVPGGADLVCYWFEKARAAIESNGLGAAGLVATNSIRGGKNRAVLDAIAKTTRIYEAWSDEGWVNEGAAVRVSLVAFGHAAQDAMLDGSSVGEIYADLSAGSANAATLDLTAANALRSNKAACFIGGMKKGTFDVSGDVARGWLLQPNPHGKGNAAVVKPWFNGLDVTRRPLDQWIVDFGLDMPNDEAALYEAPFAHVERTVRPARELVRNELEKRRWWLHARPAPDLRTAVAKLPRAIATARVAKYRLFVWLRTDIVVDGQLVVTARSDDTTFGILHSRFHEVWSLRMCTWLGVGNDPRYTPTTCFETFPFPSGLTPADTAHQRTETLEGEAVIPAFSPAIHAPKAAVGQWLGPISEPQVHEATASAPLRPGGISQPDLEQETPVAPVDSAQAAIKTAAIRIAIAARRLNELRENWLNPPEWTNRVPEVTPLGMDHSPYPDRIVPKPGFEKALQERTLTKLYNLRPAWLDAAHQALDLAVAQAYGWADYSTDWPDEEILKRLLALNLERSANG